MADGPSSPSSFETIAVSRDGPVLTVTLNRPERRNPLGLLTYREIVDALRAAEASADEPDGVRCCVLTGAGPAFSSGGELGGEAHDTTYDWVRIHDQLAGAWNAVRDLRLPVIAAVNGLCYGSGLILALHHDARFLRNPGAVERARRGFERILAGCLAAPATPRKRAR